MTECVFAIIANKHDFLMHSNLLGPSGCIENLTFQAKVFNTSLGPSRYLCIEMMMFDPNILA